MAQHGMRSVVKARSLTGFFVPLPLLVAVSKVTPPDVDAVRLVSPVEACMVRPRCQAHFVFFRQHEHLGGPLPHRAFACDDVIRERTSVHASSRGALPSREDRDIKVLRPRAHSGSDGVW